MGSHITLKSFLAEYDAPAYTYRSWVRTKHMNAYLRITRHLWLGDWVDTIDFASGGLIDSKDEGKGYFRAFMKQLEDWAAQHDRSVYVENVGSERLQAHLEKAGYTRWNKYGEKASPMYLFTPEKEA